jgi:hypothetical protein
MTVAYHASMTNDIDSQCQKLNIGKGKIFERGYRLARSEAIQTLLLKRP